MSQCVSNWCWGQFWWIQDELGRRPGLCASLKRASADRSATQGSRTLKALQGVPVALAFYIHALYPSVSHTIIFDPVCFLYSKTFSLLSPNWCLSISIGLFPYSLLRWFVSSWQAIVISHYSFAYVAKLWPQVILPDGGCTSLLVLKSTDESERVMKSGVVNSCSKQRHMYLHTTPGPPHTQISQRKKKMLPFIRQMMSQKSSFELERRPGDAARFDAPSWCRGRNTSSIVHKGDYFSLNSNLKIDVATKSKSKLPFYPTT